jgi:molybdopterin synthase sulfur carrier subunit
LSWPGTVRPHAAEATVALTPRLRRFLSVPGVDTRATRRARGARGGFRADPAVARLRARRPSHLRANVVVLLDGRRSDDCVTAADPLSARSRVHSLQACPEDDA